jgi:hypothetical protein
MEQGCWCELQGAYFANWKAKTMVKDSVQVRKGTPGYFRRLFISSNH